MLAQEPGFAAADFSHIVCIGVGGAAAPLALIEEYGRKGIKLQQGWGMTETGPLGLLLSARHGAQQGRLVRPAAALCAAEDLRSRRQRGEARARPAS